MNWACILCLVSEKPGVIHLLQAILHYETRYGIKCAKIIEMYYDLELLEVRDNPGCSCLPVCHRVSHCKQVRVYNNETKETTSQVCDYLLNKRCVLPKQIAFDKVSLISYWFFGKCLHITILNYRLFNFLSECNLTSFFYLRLQCINEFLHCVASFPLSYTLTVFGVLKSLNIVK